MERDMLFREINNINHSSTHLLELIPISNFFTSHSEVPVLNHEIEFVLKERKFLGGKIIVGGKLTLKNEGNTNYPEEQISISLDDNSKFQTTLSTWLLKKDTPILNIWKGVTLTVGIELLEAKIENGDFDVNVAKFIVSLKGKTLLSAISSNRNELSDAILNLEKVNSLKNKNYSISFDIEGEYVPDIADINKIRQIAKLAKAEAEILKKGVLSKRRLSKLEMESTKLRKQLQQRTAKLSSKARKELQDKLAKNGASIGKIVENNKLLKKQGSKLAGEILEESGKLTTKLGKRLAAKIGKSIATKVLLKFIPFINAYSTIVDIIDISKAIWSIIDGKAKFGFGYEGDGKGEAGESANEDFNLPIGEDKSVEITPKIQSGDVLPSIFISKSEPDYVFPNSGDLNNYTTLLTKTDEPHLVEDFINDKNQDKAKFEFQLSVEINFANAPNNLKSLEGKGYGIKKNIFTRTKKNVLELTKIRDRFNSSQQIQSFRAINVFIENNIENFNGKDGSQISASLVNDKFSIQPHVYVRQNGK